MIITKQKNLNDLLNSIKDGPVFIIGCNECATLCHTGGKAEILSMKKTLKKKYSNYRLDCFRASMSSSKR